MGIRWYSAYWDRELASGLIAADMSGTWEGWLRLEGDFNERFSLVARPRHFGGLPILQTMIRSASGTSRTTGLLFGLSVS